MRANRLLAGVLLLGALGAVAAPGDAASAPLGSWREGETKQAILEFVRTVTTPGPGYVPPEERIAVFDNDGTLWTEQPAYTQLLFVLDRVKTLAPRHPEWRTQEPFRSAIEGDIQALSRMDAQTLAKLLAATHAGMRPEDFVNEVRTWLRTAKHPTLGRPFPETAYLPMLELLDFLRTNGFTTFIVSSGGVDFMRAFAQDVYGIPPHQVLGTTGKLRFVVKADRADLEKLPEVGSLDGKDGKPIHIASQIGIRPILAFGNSDGDLQMLQYTALAERPGLALLLHHDDSDREVAYDRKSKIGTLDKALDEARRRGWTVVSMRRDWKTVFPPALKK